MFLLSGKKLVLEFLKMKTDFEIVYEVLRADLTPLTNKNMTLQLTKELFHQLDVLGTHFNIFVCKVPEFTASDFSMKSNPQLDKKTPIRVQRDSRLGAIPVPENKAERFQIVAPLQDPQNLGALIRSCAAFGVSTIHLTQESCHPFLPKSLKASSNGILHVKFCKAPALKDVHIDQHPVLVLDEGGQDLHEFIKSCDSKWTGYLLVGEEGQGISKVSEQMKQKNWQKISIPMKNVESLNASVAASIFIYSLRLALKE